MYKRLFIGIAAILLAGAVFAQAYKWTDEEGVVQYSDRPHEGAEIVYLSSQHTSRNQASAPRPAPQSSGRRTATPDPEEDNKPFSYDTLEITSPAPEETLWNIEGTLSLSLNVSPALQPGHRVRVYFDGAPHLMTGTSLQLQEVYRGTHDLQAEILDEAGKLMIRSQPIHFYVQQTSVAR